MAQIATITAIITDRKTGVPTLETLMVANSQANRDEIEDMFLYAGDHDGGEQVRAAFSAADRDSDSSFCIHTCKPGDMTYPDSLTVAFADNLGGTDDFWWRAVNNAIDRLRELLVAGHTVNLMINLN